MRKLIVVAVATALVASLGTYALAGHFSDVPDSHPFHDEIASVAAAGITTGFGDGTFRPSNDITRQAMAAFVERGNTRLAFDSRLPDPSTTVTCCVAEFPIVTFILGGAAGGGGGYTLSSADLVLSGGSGCPCLVFAEIIDFAGNVLGETFTIVDVGETDNVGLQGAEALPADTGDAYAVRVTHFLGIAGDVVDVRGEMSTIYIPFDFDAGNDTVIPQDDMAAEMQDLGFDPSGFPAPDESRLDEMEKIVPDSLNP